MTQAVAPVDPKLEAKRLAAGISVTDMAKRIGVTSSAICQWEQGQTFPQAKQVPAIAEAYGVDVDSLAEWIVFRKRERRQQEQETTEAGAA